MFAVKRLSIAEFEMAIEAIRLPDNSDYDHFVDNYAAVLHSGFESGIENIINKYVGNIPNNPTVFHAVLLDAMLKSIQQVGQFNDQFDQLIVGYYVGRIAEHLASRLKPIRSLGLDV